MIPLLDPVKIYTPKELAAMPLSVMNQAIEAQEAYFILEHTTQMGASHSDTSPNARKVPYPGERKVAPGTRSTINLSNLELFVSWKNVA
jgi:hypothetical protein